MSARVYKLPEHISEAIKEWLRRNSFDKWSPSQLAHSVQQISDIYTKDRSQIQRVWQQKELAAGYMVYFFPLNYLRMRAVIDQGVEVHFFKNPSNTIDFGSGPGTAQLALWDALEQTVDHCVENASHAIKVHKEMLEILDLKFPQWVSAKDISVGHETMGIFSYSLNEMQIDPQYLSSFSKLILLEPSLQTVGRQLMALRKELLQLGHFAWAPCTHQESCPLLEQSKKDWCHDRVFVELPSWFYQVENHLPMKNRSVTLSYLLTNREKPSHHRSDARVIGDTLKEKGKTRQAICRGPEREFLSWLHKEGKPPEIPRGAKIKLPDEVTKVGSEIRPPQK